MPLVYNNVGLTARSDLPDRDEAILKIASIIQSTGAQLLLDKKRCTIDGLKDCDCYTSLKDIDLLVVIGGDGTILRAVREMDDYSTPILSVNRGTVGFLAETALSEADSLIPDLLSGGGKIEKRNLMKVTATRKGENVWNGYVLNEAVISQGAISRLIDLKAMVNDEELATFHADGVIIATPTGSTAYSLSAGGPIVHPRLASIIITAINPHSFTQKPIVLPSDVSVAIEILTRGRKYGDIEVSLTLDGQVYVSLQAGDTVTASLNGEVVHFLRRKQDTFFATIRDKLKWGERIEG